MEGLPSAVNYLAMWHGNHTCRGWLLNGVKVVNHNNSILIQPTGEKNLYFIMVKEKEVKISHWCNVGLY